jgi:hypothetical protein
VVEKKYYWPLNKWPKGDYYKQISVYAQADLLNGLDGMSLKLMGLMGWSADRGTFRHGRGTFYQQ